MQNSRLINGSPFSGTAYSEYAIKVLRLSSEENGHETFVVLLTRNFDYTRQLQHIDQNAWSIAFGQLAHFPDRFCLVFAILIQALVSAESIKPQTITAPTPGGRAGGFAQGLDSWFLSTRRIPKPPDAKVDISHGLSRTEYNCTLLDLRASVADGSRVYRDVRDEEAGQSIGSRDFDRRVISAPMFKACAGTA